MANEANAKRELNTSFLESVIRSFGSVQSGITITAASVVTERQQYTIFAAWDAAPQTNSTRHVRSNLSNRKGKEEWYGRLQDQSWQKWVCNRRFVWTNIQLRWWTRKLPRTRSISSILVYTISVSRVDGWLLWEDSMVKCQDGEFDEPKVGIMQKRDTEEDLRWSAIDRRLVMRFQNEEESVTG